MNRDRKLVAAVGTAVTMYIREEENARNAARERAERAKENIWAQAGRQEIMRNRQMWQMRIVPG